MNITNFESGKWTGFYMYSNRRDKHRQDLGLTFTSGSVIRGCGNDDIGAFQIKGQFNSEAKEATWVKKYVGGHSVFYRGFCDAMQKALWGIWEIGKTTRGGFKIWLVGQGHLDGEMESEAKPMVVVLGQLVPAGEVVKSNERCIQQKKQP